MLHREIAFMTVNRGILVHERPGCEPTLIGIAEPKCHHGPTTSAQLKDNEKIQVTESAHVLAWAC